MRYILRLLVSLFFAWTCTAQETTLTARVIDAIENTPLSGANVVINESGGVTTGPDGTFAVRCSGSARLSITFLGYRPWEQTVSCDRRGMLEIALEPEAQQLVAVEITATSNASKSLLEQPNSLVKIDQPALKRGMGLFLEDAINTGAPGVTMQRRTQSGGQQLNIRGYGNGMGIRGVNNNFDGQGLKAYLNGIPLTDAEGITVLDDIDYYSISGVEILKGPSGTLYGLAIAGVVNLQTERAPKGASSLGQDLMVGDYGLVRTTTRLRVGGEYSSLLLSYGRQEFDGFMPHTASSKEFGNLNGHFDLGERQALDLYLGYSDSYDQRNGELTREQYEIFDYSGNPRYIKNNAHSAVRSFRAGATHTYRFSDKFSNTTTLFGASQDIDNSSAGGWTDKQSLNYGLRSVVETRFDISDALSLSGITGVEVQEMQAQTIGYGMGADSTNLDGYNVITSLRSNQASTNSVGSYFTQWTLGLPLDFSLSAGIGISGQRLHLEDRLWGLGNNQPGNPKLPIYERRYRNLVSPSVAVNKRLGSSVSVYAALSTGQKAPVASNILIATTGALNTGLSPEKGIQLEVGSKGSLLENRLFYTVAAFSARFKNKFTTVTVQNPENTATLYSYLVNGGSLQNKGLELLAQYRVIDGGTGWVRSLQPFANATISDFTYSDYRFERAGTDANDQPVTVVEDYSGNKVAGVAPFVFNTGADLETAPGVYANATYHYQGRMPYTSDGLNETDPYGLLTAKLGYRQAWEHFRLDAYAGAVNITGAQYYNMVFVNQLPDAYIPAPQEINFFGGVNLAYTF